MSASTEKLLSSYKDYESLVRDTGRDPKEVEDQAPELEGQRLRMCRRGRSQEASEKAGCCCDFGQHEAG